MGVLHGQRWGTGAVLAGLVLVAGAAPVAAQAKIRIGYQSLWAGQGEIFETLVRTNILELNGVPAEFKRFTYGGPLGEAAVAGEIDTAIAADTPILRIIGRRSDFKVVNRSHDWVWHVMARPDTGINGLADLRGKKLAAPFGTTVFPRTYRKLVELGIREPFKELTIVNQDIAEQASSLQAKAVDAVVSWPPTSERLRAGGLAKVIYEGQKGEGLGWQAVGPGVLKDRDLAVRYLKSYVMAVWWASNNLDTAMKWFAETSRIDPQLLRKFAMDDRYLRAPVKDLKEIDLVITDKEVADAQAVMDFLLEQKLLTSKLDVKAAVDMSYLRQAQSETRAGRHPKLADVRVVRP
jgi:ABC-type nitrate/sulfonate/bicarbonate transport system substrate-binding protein